MMLTDGKLTDRSKRMRLLIITHTFPPSAHSNAKRPYYIAKGALEAGWQVDVITSVIGLSRGQEETLQHPELRVFRRSDPVLALLQRLANRHWLGGMMTRIFNGFLWPDFCALWAKGIFRDRACFAGYDRVLAFVFPPSVLLAGQRAGLVGPHWTFDLQESVSPQFKRFPRKFVLQRLLTPKLARVERSTLHQAGRVVFTSETNREAYVAAGLVPAAVTGHVPYFFDAGVFAADRRADPGFEIRYYGGFDLYGDRNPGTFLQALVAFLERHPEARSETRFVFHGNWLPNHDIFLAKAGLEGVVQIRASLSYEDYLVGLTHSPILLLVVAAAHNLFMPSKIVDYFGARRPILAFVPDHSEMRRVLDKAGMADYAADVNDVAGGALAIERLWHRYRANALELEGPRTEQWSSTVQLPRFLGIVAMAGQVNPINDLDALWQVFAVMERAGGRIALVRRNGRKHLGLPANREAAGYALALYHPQRRMAKVVVHVLRLVTAVGLHRCLLPAVRISPGRVTLSPPMPEVIPGTCGVMFGTPAHRVRRSIASFKTANGWEAAKVAFGPAAWEQIQSEVAALASLPLNTRGVYPLLGVHRGPDIALIRMSYFRGRILSRNDWAQALELLECWKLDLAAKPMHQFPEWPTIEAALSGSDQGRAALAQLSQRCLRPVVRHGDFARWNILRTPNGELVVLDWELGVANGMPGIDLVHLFAQDAKLVLRLSPLAVIRAVEHALHRPECMKYLDTTGWDGDVRGAILASVAFAGAAKRKADQAVLAAALQGLV
jgi:hypothetical protein